MNEPKGREGRPARRGRAIVTYGRGLHALAAIRSLGRHGVDVIVADEVGVTPGSLSRYAVDGFTYPNALKDTEGFLQALEDAVTRFDPGHPEVPYVLMPIHQETSVVAEAQDRFASRIRLPLASPEAFATVAHKGRFAKAAQARGWPVPPTRTFADEAEVIAAASELAYPAFIKHPAASSGVGVHRVEGPDELLARYRELVGKYGLAGDDAPLVQPEMPGDDYCVTALYRRGQCRVTLAYRNVLRYPRDGGPGAVRETVRAPELEAVARRVLDDIGWHGIAQVDFRWTGREGDSAYVLEINPRFFGGVAQAIESGVDYPWLLFRLAVDGDVRAPDHIDYDVRTEKPVLGLLATIEEIAASDERLERLERAWDDAKEALGRRDMWQALGALFDRLKDSVDLSERVERARAVLLENEHNVSMLFDSDDPLPVLGYIYPLALFVRHGRLSQALLSGTER